MTFMMMMMMIMMMVVVAAAAEVAVVMEGDSGGDVGRGESQIGNTAAVSSAAFLKLSASNLRGWPENLERPHTPTVPHP